MLNCCVWIVKQWEFPASWKGELLWVRIQSLMSIAASVDKSNYMQMEPRQHKDKWKVLLNSACSIPYMNMDCSVIAWLFQGLIFIPRNVKVKTSIHFSSSRVGCFGSGLKQDNIFWRERGSKLWQKNITWVQVVWRACSGGEEASVFTFMLCIGVLGVFPGPSLRVASRFSLEEPQCLANITWI